MVGMYNQLKYCRWTEWMLMCVIVPLILGILIGGGLVAIVRNPVIVLVVASLVSIAVMIVRNRPAKQQPVKPSALRREPLAPAGSGPRR